MIDESDDVDVAVVGYGPTGLVAASLLGGMGHRVVVVEQERKPGPGAGSRVAHHGKVAIRNCQTPRVASGRYGGRCLRVLLPDR